MTYLVQITHGEYSDFNFTNIGIFDSIEKAEIAANQYNELLQSHWDKCPLSEQRQSKSTLHKLWPKKNEKYDNWYSTKLKLGDTEISLVDCEPCVIIAFTINHYIPPVTFID